MDSKKHGLYSQCYVGSTVKDISAYFNEYREVIEKSSFYKHYAAENNQDLFKVVGEDVNEEKYNLLEDYCSVDQLTVPGELNKMTKGTFEWGKDSDDPSAADAAADALQTVACTKQRNLLKNYQVKLKYRSEKPIVYERSKIDCQEVTLVPESDILIFVRVYYPFSSRSKQSTGVFTKLSLDCIIALYGSQTLDKLRDQITCISDHSISMETSQTPIKQRAENAKNVYKSGFFFIEDTFYNDFRDVRNNDNSKVIRDWAEAHNYGTYKTAKMEETRIDSLVLKFGFPWVYQHQGDCEHLISFSDARLVNASDELNASCYPRKVRIKPRSNRYCMTCGIYNVSWVTVDNNRLPHNPCLFCESCFHSYNYIKGKKLGSFKAYHYPFDSTLLQTKPRRRLKAKTETAQK